MIRQSLTEQQLFDLFRPAVQMPPDTSRRIKSRVLAEVRRLRDPKLRRLHRRLGLRCASVVVALLVMLSAGNASAQVRCDPCRMRVLLPIVHVSEAE